MSCFVLVKRLEIERSTEREPLDFKPLMSEKGTDIGDSFKLQVILFLSRSMI